MKLARALFLDRDGTINVDLGTYVNSVAETRFEKGVELALIKAFQAGFKIYVITNQAGVAKKITPADVPLEIHRWMEKEIQKIEPGFYFSGLEFCPHLPDAGCECRKPKHQMIEKILTTTAVDRSQSFMIGDRLNDVICGNNSGLQTILLRTGHGREEEIKVASAPKNAKPTFGIFENLATAIDKII